MRLYTPAWVALSLLIALAVYALTQGGGSAPVVVYEAEESFSGRWHRASLPHDRWTGLVRGEEGWERLRVVSGIPVMVVESALSDFETEAGTHLETETDAEPQTGPEAEMNAESEVNAHVEAEGQAKLAADDAPVAQTQPEIAVVAYMGMMPTGGHSIGIRQVEFVPARGRDWARILVRIYVTSPGPDELVTQAFTYPIQAVMIPSESLPEGALDALYKGEVIVDVIDQDGRDWGPGHIV